MPKIATDIALIPEDNLIKLAEVLSKKLAEQGSKLVLGEHAVPHITLAQGVIDEFQLDNIRSSLETVVGEYNERVLVAEDLYTGPMSKAVWLKVRKTKQIDNLHRKIMTQMIDYFSDVVDKSMFAGEVEDSTVHWVKDFLLKASFENYQPHITLGYGTLNEINLPMEFQISELALYQLGNCCTCHTKVFGVEI